MNTGRQPLSTGLLRLLCDLLSRHPHGTTENATAIDWEAIFLLAGQYLVTPSLTTALEATSQLANLPQDEKAYLIEVRELNRKRNVFLRSELERVAKALNASGIMPIIMKGAIALLPAQYSGSEDRVLTDFDIQVPEQALLEARNIIISLGYDEDQSYERWLTNADKTKRHHISALRHPSMPLTIELHRRFVSNATDNAELARHATFETITLSNGASVLLPDPATRLLHNMLHAQISHRQAFTKELDVRQLLEFSLLVKHFWEDIRSTELLRRLPPSRRWLLSEYWAKAERWFGLLYPSDLPRSSRERWELHIVNLVSTNRRARMLMRSCDWARLLPRRLIGVAIRTWEFPAFLPYRMKRLLLRE